MADANASVQAAAPTDDGDALVELYRSWGILDLLGETVERMPAEWLEILNIARCLLSGRPIPGVALPEEMLALLAREEQVTYERRTFTVTRRRTGVAVVDEPQVRPIESMAEFPRVLVNQRMWQYIDADLFLYKLYTHDVLVKEKEQVREIAEETEETVEEWVPVYKPRHKRRQKVLVLRDTSSSMNDNRKGVFAKAVALAYLIKAHEEGAEVSDRSYANRVHPRLRATTTEEFGAIARRILKEGNYGTTDLAAALDVTISEIRREEVGFDANARAKTEILLISDCENPVALPPLPPGVTVNTLHLEGGREGLMLRDYQERLREIQEISRLFLRIDTSALRLPDALEEAWLVLQESAAGVQEEQARGATLADADRDPSARARASTVERLTAIYDRLGEQNKDYRAMKVRLGGGGLGSRMPALAWLRMLWAVLLRAVGGARAPRPRVRPRRVVEGHIAMVGGRVEFRPKHERPSRV
jgi:Mg-chelatase subunit ChlD